MARWSVTQLELEQIESNCSGAALLVSLKGGAEACHASGVGFPRTP